MLRQNLLDSLPGMPKLIHKPVVWEALQLLPQLYGNEMVRRELEKLRQRILDADDKELTKIDIDPDKLAEQIATVLREKAQPSVHPAVNAAGIILHTALGRAPLCKEAQEALKFASQGYCTMAIDRETGRRGDRYKHVEDLLCFITGAEAGCVVNNNAAATMVLLNTIAQGKEVIVSRGQLVEIGGSFRIPDVMRRSGAVLVEVGTTNKTHPQDYVNAIGDNTALILRVHASNYLMTGFTSEVTIKELTEIAHSHGLPLADDIGSGCLYDTTQYGLAPEPKVQDSVRDGADLICFSGDKMLGGPQCGIIVGKKKYIDKVKKNPLVRAFRCDKLTYSALEATLKLYLDEATLPQKLPILRMLTMTRAQIARIERSFLNKIESFIEGKCQAKIVNGFSLMGSGSLPGRDIPTKLIELHPLNTSVEELAYYLRKNNPPIFTRIENDAVILDFRTVQAGDEKLITEVIKKIFMGE